MHKAAIITDSPAAADTIARNNGFRPHEVCRIPANHRDVAATIRHTTPALLPRDIIIDTETTPHHDLVDLYAVITSTLETRHRHTTDRTTYNLIYASSTDSTLDTLILQARITVGDNPHRTSPTPDHRGTWILAKDATTTYTIIRERSLDPSDVQHVPRNLGGLTAALTKATRPPHTVLIVDDTPEAAVTGAAATVTSRLTRTFPTRTHRTHIAGATPDGTSAWNLEIIEATTLTPIETPADQPLHFRSDTDGLTLTVPTMAGAHTLTLTPDTASALLNALTQAHNQGRF